LLRTKSKSRRLKGSASPQHICVHLWPTNCKRSAQSICVLRVISEQLKMNAVNSSPCPPCLRGSTTCKHSAAIFSLCVSSCLCVFVAIFASVAPQSFLSIRNKTKGNTIPHPLRSYFFRNNSLLHFCVEKWLRQRKNRLPFVARTTIG
jgi:hypothetical protein